MPAARGRPGYREPVIIWLNGGFGAGKTTLAAELHRRLPDAVVYDPEDVGLMLWKWLPRNGDFQHLPSWRELVVATALSLRRHHGDTLIVPISLIRDAGRRGTSRGRRSLAVRLSTVWVPAHRRGQTEFATDANLAWAV
jgi:hypothetical protein